MGYICKPANEIGVMLGSPEDQFKSGATRRVNIACDCYLAIIKDITKKI